MLHYNEVMDFLKQHKRRPSKYTPENRRLLHWLKYNKRAVVQQKFTPEQQRLFGELLEQCRQVQRLNQYCYVSDRGQQLDLSFDD